MTATLIDIGVIAFLAWGAILSVECVLRNRTLNNNKGTGGSTA